MFAVSARDDEDSASLSERVQWIGNVAWVMWSWDLLPAVPWLSRRHRVPAEITVSRTTGECPRSREFGPH